MHRLLTFLTLGAVIISCTSEDRIQGEQKELPSQIVNNFHMHESSSGNKRYYLTGTRAFFYDKSNHIQVLDPHIFFYGPDREVTSEVVCDSGTIFNRTGDLAAYGHVKVTTQDSTVLRTDSLRWYNRRARIETDGMVYIQSGDGTIEGKGLVSDADLTRIEIKEEISGTTGYSIEEQEEEGQP